VDHRESSKVEDPDEGGKRAREVVKNIRTAPRAAAPALVKFLKDPEPEIRLKVALVLSQLEEADQECLTALVGLVNRRDRQIREAAARLLYRYGSAAKAAVPALIEMARNEPYPAKNFAITTLGAIGPDAKAAIPALRALLKDYQEQAAAAKKSPNRRHQYNYDGLATMVQDALKKIDQ
jgi:HEAT repeat protein